MTSDALDPKGFAFEGGSTGVLLLHGYTAASPEMRPIGEYLANKGLTVVVPLLPGHGTTPEDLNTRTWREVADAAASELYDLQGKCDRVYVGGLSMGGLLALHLGQRCSGIAGLIPMAAALYLRDPLSRLLPLLRHFISTFPKSKDVHVSIEDPASAELIWSYDQNPVRFAAEVLELMHHVRRRLPQIDLPILAFHGARDRTVPTKAARALGSQTASQDVEVVILKNSGHCLSIDGEREQVADKIWQWIQAHKSG